MEEEDDDDDDELHSSGCNQGEQFKALVYNISGNNSNDTNMPKM